MSLVYSNRTELVSYPVRGCLFGEAPQELEIDNLKGQLSLSLSDLAMSVREKGAGYVCTFTMADCWSLSAHPACKTASPPETGKCFRLRLRSESSSLPCEWNRLRDEKDQGHRGDGVAEALPLGGISMTQLSAMTVRTWYRVHKWTSLICTAFLLMACITGLPLIFEEELNQVLTHPVAPVQAPAGMPDASLDAMVKTAHAHFPNLKPLFVAFDDDEPRVFVTMASSLNPKPAETHAVIFDRHTGKQLETIRPGKTFTSIVLQLHREIFAGVPGELLMGLMAFLFVIAVISGAVVYGPFMRKLNFGTVRKEINRRVYWFDLHNLIGIVTLLWAFVVGATGFLNALSTPLFGLWRAQTMPALLAPYHGKPAPLHLSSIDAAVSSAMKALPGMTISSITFPNAVLTSPLHYIVWTKGNTPVTSRLFTPVLIDAETGNISAIKPLPWYLRAIEVSRPFHFGDYGGMPLKIIWAVFDVGLIAVLGSGLYLWLSRRKTFVEEELDKLVALEQAAGRTGVVTQ